jgi:hypothetical protein
MVIFIALCSYCTEVHTLILHWPWLFYVAPVVTLGNSVLPTKCMAVIFGCQHKGAIFPVHSVTLSDFFGRSAVSTKLYELNI